MDRLIASWFKLSKNVISHESDRFFSMYSLAERSVRKEARGAAIKIGFDSSWVQEWERWSELVTILPCESYKSMNGSL